jgi:hypothetical protein
MLEILTVGIENWFEALPLVIPLILVIAVVVARRERGPVH